MLRSVTSIKRPFTRGSLLARYQHTQHTNGNGNSNGQYYASTGGACKNFDLEKDFGKYVFNDEKMKNRLAPELFKRYKDSMTNGHPMDVDVADAIAHAMKEWALSQGATHYSHWFQPLTGWTAEKHDSFITPSPSGALTQFKGKTLISGETDGSSFPNGGLRPTYSARGYTVWDPQTPAFLMMENGVPTLFLPSMFLSYKGHALDRKAPLLRALTSLGKVGKKLFPIIDLPDHTEFHSDSGVEQEFFIIKADHFHLRPDLVAAGRTVQGSNPSKSQQLCDHYFAPLPSHAVQFIHQVECALWKLGIPLTTRHQEVAPNQFEWAPVFTRASVASDQNMLAMEVMKRIGENQGLTVLLHEKPFARVNGSGKHNNWSLGTNKVGSIFAPGDKPESNNLFLLGVAAVLRSVDLYAPLFRWAISGASNDHRLGGHEAPPAILSVYLGDYVGAIVQAMVDDAPVPDPVYPKDDNSIPYLPKRKLDDTDRNRTSPIAFTGNKFEVRGVGSSQVPAFSNFVLAATSADSLEYLAGEIEKYKAKGDSTNDAVRKAVVDTFRQHQRIIMNGDGYSPEWQIEAAKRGLPNLISTVDALDAVDSSQHIKDMLNRYGVLSYEEMESHLHVDYLKYATTIQVEAGCLRNMANKYIIPAAIKHQNLVLQNSAAVPSILKDKIKAALEDAVKTTEDLSEKVEKVEDFACSKQQARFCSDNVLPAMATCRKALDHLEAIVDHDLWPFPTYEEILLARHTNVSGHQCGSSDE